MKLNRKQLRKLILKEINMDESMNGRSMIFNMVEEIEGSHGGLDAEEAAEELVRRLINLPGHTDVMDILSSVVNNPQLVEEYTNPEELAEAVLTILLRQRSAERRSMY